LDGQKTRGNGGVGIQHSTINNKIDGVWHGGSNGGSLEKNRSNGMDGRPGASGAQTTMTIWHSHNQSHCDTVRIRSGQGGEVEKQVGSGEFRRGRWSGVSLALEMPKGSGMIGSIAKKQNR